MVTSDQRESLSAVIDDIHRALIPTSTTNELTQHVCEQFAASPLYDHAWVGEYNTSANTVIPKVSAGIDPDTLSIFSLDDEATSHVLIQQALETHTLQTNQNPTEASIPEDIPDHAHADGSQSHAVLPLVYEDTLYSVLHLATDRSDAFDTAERTALSELSERIGYALADVKNYNREQHQRMREALKDEDEFITNALEGLPDLFYVTDLEGNFLHWNDAFEEVTGYDEDDILSMHPLEFFAGDDIDRFSAAFQRVVDGNRERIEVTLVTKHGEKIPIEATGTLLENDDEDVLGICGTARDITERKQREQQIARQRDQLATLKDQLLEIVPTGIVIFNADGEPTQFNDRAVDILGLPPDRLTTLLNDPDWTMFDAEGDLIPESRFPVNRVLETGRPVFNEELRLERPDDESVWLSVNAAPLSEHTGEITTVVAFEDITEQKQREQYLQEAKIQLEAATEAGAVGTWEWKIPEDEFVTGASFARTFGVDPEVARSGVSIDQFASAIHEGDRERVKRKIEDAVESCGEYEAEYRVWNADDEVRWVIARGHVECDEAGNPLRFPGALTDITDRKRAEQALQKSKKQLRTLIQLLPVGVVVADADGRLLKANKVAEEIWGGIVDADSVAEYEQYAGWWADTSESAEPEEWPLARALRGEKVTEPEVFEIERPDGKRRTIMTYAMPVQDESGNVERAVATLVDITERQKRKQQLQRQNNRLESFASMLAHELRNPLSIAQIYLQQAQSGDEAAFEEVDMALNRIEEMIDILLILARGKDSEINPESVSLGETATDVWSNLDVPSDWLDVETDTVLNVEAHHLQHILENLFENAIKHGGDTVAVRVGRLEDGFYVADDGPGVPEAERDHVFEAGYTTDTNGIGLGLTFIAQLAEAYDWDCMIAESAVGGARFEFRNIGVVTPND